MLCAYVLEIIFTSPIPIRIESKILAATLLHHYMALSPWFPILHFHAIYYNLFTIQSKFIKYMINSCTIYEKTLKQYCLKFNQPTNVRMELISDLGTTNKMLGSRGISATSI